MSAQSGDVSSPVPVFVLVPGAGGQAWYWHRLVPELRARGFDAVAVDLPAADESAGLEVYTRAVLEAAGDRPDVVVVGQSMGGLTAPLVCVRRRVRLLVLLNAMIPAPGETGGEWWARSGYEAFRAAARAEAGGDADGEGGFDPFAVFFHDVPPDVVEQASAHGDPPQSSRPFEDPWPLPAWPDVPTRVLAGADDRFFPPEFQRRLARERLGLDADEIPGGHLVALSRPVELADRFVAYLRELADDARAGAVPPLQSRS
ncbi:MAG: alpha/beta fold hydrolase [Kineosporiaceae bacterium]